MPRDLFTGPAAGSRPVVCSKGIARIVPPPPLSPSPYLTRFATGDEFAAALLHARLAGEALGPDAGDWRVLRVPLPHGSFQVGRNGAMAMSYGPIGQPGMVTLALVVEPRTPHFFNGHDIRTGVILYRDGSEFCGHSTSPAFWASVSLDTGLLRARYGALAGGGDLPAIRGNSCVVEPQAGHLEALRGLMRSFMAAAETGTVDFSRPETVAAVEDSLLTAVVWTLLHGRIVRRKDYRQRAAIVRQAREALRASSGEPMTVPGLSAVLGVNERVLYYAFREYLGMSPMRYLKVHRLTAARRALLDAGPDESVATLAMRVGFQELGRFAGEYRAMFGEVPSDTLRRKTAPAPQRV